MGLSLFFDYDYIHQPIPKKQTLYLLKWQEKTKKKDGKKQKNGRKKW